MKKRNQQISKKPWNYGTIVNNPVQECMHDRCPECHGTGKKWNGQMCVHMLSCPCPKCSPQFMAESEKNNDFSFQDDMYVIEENNTYSM